jgi:hypothetical protein
MALSWQEAYVDGMAWVCCTFLVWRGVGAVWRALRHLE